MKKTNRTFKRFAAITSASLLAACAVAPAVSYAVTLESGGKSITINSSYAHTDIKAYEIFSGKDTDEGLNITGWGNGINIEQFVTDIKADVAFENAFTNVKYGTGVEGALAESVTDSKVAVAVANVIDSFANNSLKAELIAKYAVKNRDKDNQSGTYDATAKTISKVSVGYYIVVDESGADTNASESITEKAYSLGMLKVAAGTNEISVTTKMGLPSLTKQIKDINDSTGVESWGTDADHDIKDTVSFRLTATLPTNLDDYDQYKLVFHDNLQADVFAIDNNNTVTVKYYASDDDEVGVEVTTHFTKDLNSGINSNFSDDNLVDSEGNVDKTENLTLTCNDITNIVTGTDPDTQEPIVLPVTSSGKFVVEYTAKLTENANIGADGNWNSSYLEYSNNPNFIGAGTNDNPMPTENTPEQTAVAFTYKLDVSKIDGGTGDELSTAGFTLYKKDVTSKDLTNNHEDVIWNKVTEINNKSTFEFVGLDDGIYKLVETQVPQYYNKADDVIFAVTGNHASKVLKNLTIDNTKVTASSATVGLMETTIENNRGSSLPSTGGIGTTIFYLGGGAMAAIGGVYLISKRRMKKSEE